MIYKKQNSIDYLIDQLKEYDISINNEYYIIKIPVFMFDEKQQISENMHEQEHLNTWNKAIDAHEKGVM